MMMLTIPRQCGEEYTSARRRGEKAQTDVTEDHRRGEK